MKKKISIILSSIAAVGFVSAVIALIFKNKKKKYCIPESTEDFVTLFTFRANEAVDYTVTYDPSLDDICMQEDLRDVKNAIKHYCDAYEADTEDFKLQDNGVGTLSKNNDCVFYTVSDGEVTLYIYSDEELVYVCTEK